MKEHEYNENLSHGMAHYQYVQASKYGIVNKWTDEHGTFEDYSVLPGGLLNANGLALLKEARGKGWDHRNFFYYKRLGINWFGEEGLKSFIDFTGISQVQSETDFVMPSIAASYKKPYLSSPDIYHPINLKQAGLLGQEKAAEKISTIWDDSTRIDYDFSMFNWGRGGFPVQIPQFLTYKSISDLMFASSKVTKYEPPLEVLGALGRTELHQVLEDEFYTREFKDLFADLIVEHGLFIGLWYSMYFEHKMVRSLGKLRLRADYLERLFNEAYGISEVSATDLGTFTKIAGHIFWQMIYHSVSEPSIRSRIQSWIERLSQPRNCARCDRLFTPILIEPEYYFGSNANTLMCFGCIEPESPDAQDLNKLINNFVDACGFPPPDGVSPIDWRVNIKIPHSQQVNSAGAWAAMGGIHHVKNTLDMSWFRAMYEAGSLPDGTIPTGRGIKCMAIDGHECGSLDEKTIDDLLTKHGIDHKKEPYYPQHPVLNPNAKRRADWQIGDKLVEYFGLAGNIAYDKRTKEKIQLAAETGIDLIGLFPEDVVDLKSSLIEKL